MKIMFVDTGDSGHRQEYVNSLRRIPAVESILLIPDTSMNLKSVADYVQWMKHLKKIAEKEQPDIIHFLDGDTVMRYFGIGFGFFKRFKTVITFHHFFSGLLRRLSFHHMLHAVNLGVVHTEEIEKRIRGYGCTNIACVPYPCFLRISCEDNNRYENQPPILLALGGTRFDKGLDILLGALKKVRLPFQLVIAGKEDDFQREFILEQIKEYKENVKLILHFLKTDEVLELLQKADIIILPYRKEFDGASGPMCEGVYLGKTIIGPNHGSLGSLIQKNHVGYVFESENQDNLAEIIEKALSEKKNYDTVAKRYQKELQPETFNRRYQKLYNSLVDKID